MDKGPSHEKPTLPGLPYEQIFDKKGYLYGGHGTNPASVDGIFKRGLFLTLDSSLEHVIGLESDKPEQTTDKLQNWPHYRLKDIVIVAVPNKKIYNGLHGFIADVSKERDLPLSENGVPMEYQIPRKFIKGVVHVETGEWVPNPHFDEDVPFAKVERNSPLEWLRKRARKRLNEVGLQVTAPVLPAGDIPHVW